VQKKVELLIISLVSLFVLFSYSLLPQNSSEARSELHKTFNNSFNINTNSLLKTGEYKTQAPQANPESVQKIGSYSNSLTTSHEPRKHNDKASNQTPNVSNLASTLHRSRIDNNKEANLHLNSNTKSFEISNKLQNELLGSDCSSQIFSIVDSTTDSRFLSILPIHSTLFNSDSEKKGMSSTPTQIADGSDLNSYPVCN
jgi:hypothetical protein